MKRLLLSALLFLSVLPGVAAADGIVYLSPQLKFGLSVFRSISVLNSSSSVKATNGNLYGWYLFNAAASTRFFKIYNEATATVGTSTPIFTIPVPAGGAANVEFSNGITFTTAISMACTTGVADSDTGAPSANDCVANLLFK